MNINEKMKIYFCAHPETPPVNVKGDHRCSVHFKNTFRLSKAKEQLKNEPTPIPKVIERVNEFLISIDMQAVSSPIFYCPNNIDYHKIKDEYGLKKPSDIVWLKFTEDGYLGVVATSNDINFDIPNDVNDYDAREQRYNSYNHKVEKVWKHNSSGILVHQTHKKWDPSFVLIFPLKDITCGYKNGDIERAIGNYLIDKKVPIIDFFSHNY